MSNETENQSEKQSGVNLDKITFGKDGEIAGLDDNVLDAFSGGLLREDMNICCPECD